MPEEYFETVPDWTSSPRFSVMADQISGRIPATRLDHWKQFAELLEDDFFYQSDTQFVFRGHRRFDYSLLPTLGRVTENGIVTEELAERQMALFRRAVRGRLTDNSLLDESGDSTDELWSIGQHHGLMTPLLDWTYSPYVGLFFAFAKEDQAGEEDNPYRVVYALNKTFVSNDRQCPDIRLLEPRKDDHGRLVNQAGLFTFSPSDSTIENKLIDLISDFDEFKQADEDAEAELLAKYICKIYIRNEDREGCLRTLRQMNVHHASLFPDLLGASEYCNVLIEEDERERAIRQVSDKLTERLGRRDKVSTKPSIEDDDLSVSSPVDPDKVATVVDLLQSPKESAQVEPARIQLMANKIAEELRKHAAIDWKDRESVQAKLRNVTRVTLRKLGYPASASEQVVDNILKVAESEIDNSDD